MFRDLAIVFLDTNNRFVDCKFKRVSSETGELRKYVSSEGKSYQFVGKVSNIDDSIRAVIMKEIRTVEELNCFININGERYHCEKCGGNVFTKYSNNSFECHGCSNEYQAYK